MAKAKRPSQANRDDVERTVLGGLSEGKLANEILHDLRRYADYMFPFPGDVLTEIGAGALAAAGAAASAPVSLADATRRHLTEWTVTGNTAHQKHRSAMQAAIGAHGGIVIDYDEIAGWWQVQDFTLHAFEAAVVLVRVAAEHTGRTVASVCDEIGEHLRLDARRL